MEIGSRSVQVAADMTVVVGTRKLGCERWGELRRSSVGGGVEGNRPTTLQCTASDHPNLPLSHAFSPTTTVASAFDMVNEL